MSKTLQQTFTGSRLTVEHCDGAIESFEKALCQVSPAQKKLKMAGIIWMQIERLANGERLSAQHFPSEGSLPPDQYGNVRKFWALKKIPVRGYGWFSSKYPNRFYISHYIYKKKDKLDPKDTEKVKQNWRSIEES